MGTSRPADRLGRHGILDRPIGALRPRSRLPESAVHIGQRTGRQDLLVPHHAIPLPGSRGSDAAAMCASSGSGSGPLRCRIRARCDAGSGPARWRVSRSKAGSRHGRVAAPGSITQTCVDIVHAADEDSLISADLEEMVAAWSPDGAGCGARRPDAGYRTGGGGPWGRELGDCSPVSISALHPRRRAKGTTSNPSTSTPWN